MCSSRGLEISCCSLGKMKYVGFFCFFFFFPIRKLYAKSWLHDFKESITPHSFCVNQYFSLEGQRKKILLGEKVKYSNKVYSSLKQRFRTDSYKIMHHIHYRFLLTNVLCLKNHKCLPKDSIAKFGGWFFLFSLQHIFFLTYDLE